jgi:hypothetical protein
MYVDEGKNKLLKIKINQVLSNKFFAKQNIASVQNDELLQESDN